MTEYKPAGPSGSAGFFLLFVGAALRRVYPPPGFRMNVILLVQL
jgi:hypothetical protein